MQELSAAVYELIEKFVPKEDILKAEPMCKHTTFRIGGDASCFIRISSEEQLAGLIAYMEQLEKTV